MSIFSVIDKSYGNSEFPNLKGIYFGQKLPGLISEVFAPDIVSINGRYEYGISFSPDLNEIYFSTQKEGGVASIHFSNIEDGKWQPIKKLKLTNGLKAGEMHPFVSRDGKKIYFTAYSSDFTDTKIWTANRTNNGWSNATKLDSPINDREVFYSILAKNGDLFYTDIFKSKTYFSAFEDGKYPKTKEVEIEFGLHPFISPSQDYLLVDAVAKDQNRKDKDIYVYFKKTDGTWSKPINLGSAVNSNYTETVPSVTPDGKYLFFSRYNEEEGLSNFYWVSTKVIERFRPK
ncbi:PD40 domain-containing protein [Thalassomonas viridans]|uniref:PD40 domain-containing protein n=2 Tax=Thalassomonas viridans TaxID=137584 RepID=A0AAE9Z960_9GAMM|nr:PD40 domain-containing protein [Thalassomonas viridans]